MTTKVASVMMAQNQMDKGRRLPIAEGAFLIFLVSGMVAGIAPVATGGTLLIATAVSALFFVSKGKLHKSARWIVAYLSLAAVSAVLFGGFASARHSGMMAWLSGEGRAFIYFAPLLLFLALGAAAATVRRRSLSFAMLAAGTVNLVLVTVHNLTAVRIFSSHHAAGVTSAAIFILAYFLLMQRKLATSDFIIMAISGFTLIASNSRSSLIAVMLAIGAIHLLKFELRRLMFIIAFGAVALVTMSLLFPSYFDRLRSASTSETYSAALQNFELAARSDPPVETSLAWSVTEFGRISGDPNAAIRGYLWGRAFNEFTASPLVGAGFGRFNDLGREFHTVIGQGVATEAEWNNPNDHTAHNTYLHILAELGLIGLCTIGFAILGLWKFLWVASVAPRANEFSRRLAEAGLASLVFVLVGGITNHSLGAPIYGLSAMTVVGLAMAGQGRNGRTLSVS